MTIKNDKISFLKEQKRKTLIEFSKGNKGKAIFAADFLNARRLLKNRNKKYASKMLYKWRNEMYRNRELIHFQSLDMNDDNLKYEIGNLAYSLDNEKDEIAKYIEKQLNLQKNNNKNLKCL